VAIEKDDAPASIFAPFTATVSFPGKEIPESNHDTSIERETTRGGLRLKRGEIISDEVGNAQFNTDRTAFEATDSLLVPWWIGEKVTDRIWIKKDLLLENPAAEKAQLMFFYQLWANSPMKGNYLGSVGGSNAPIHISINGAELPPVYPDMGARNRAQDWRLVEFPAILLKKGINSVVFRTEKDGDWRFAYENSKQPNRSARSTDSGRTWNYNRLGENAIDNGEYLIRFYLDRYHRKGIIWSQPAPMGGEGDNPTFLKRVRNVTLEIAPEIVLPKGTAAHYQARFGTSLVPGDETWTGWGKAFSGRSFRVTAPEGDFRYFQWRAVLLSEQGRETPLLQSVAVRVSGEREQLRDERQVTVEKLGNPPLLLSSLEQKHDPFENEMLKSLREWYHLDEVIKPGKNELEQFTLLASWVHEYRYSGAKSRAEHMKKYPINRRTTHWAPNNAIWALDMFSRGWGHLDRQYGSHCHDYNCTYAGCLAALGFTARPLIMNRMRSSAGGHSFPEVWSYEHNRWVYVDAYRNQYYIWNDGTPANTLEIHNAQFDSTMFRRISTVQMSRLPEPGKTREPFQTLPCPEGYEVFGIWPRNDYFEQPGPYPIWDGVSSFRWDDRLWYLDNRVQYVPEFSKYSDRDSDFYPSTNQCFIQPEYRGRETAVIRLSHTMPNFKNYEVRLNGAETWKEYPGDFLLKIPKGRSTVEVRPVNKWGLRGAPSTVEFSNQVPD
jgi:hypothetical protein